MDWVTPTSQGGTASEGRSDPIVWTASAGRSDPVVRTASVGWRDPTVWTASVVQIILIALLLSSAACGDESTKPDFQPNARIQGQVVYYDDDPVAEVLIRRFDATELAESDDEWQVALDDEGRFDVPVPAGRYAVLLLSLPTASHYSQNRVYVTPWGFRDSFHSDTCGIVADPELPPATLHAELGRTAVRLVVPFEDTRPWQMELRTPDSGISWIRETTEEPESGEILFEMTRLPMTGFLVTLLSPFGEFLSPRLLLSEDPVGLLRPDPQALEEYRAVLPEPTWIEIRTSPIPGAPRSLFGGFFGGAFFVAGYDEALARMSVGEDETYLSGRVAVFNQIPFRVGIYRSDTSRLYARATTGSDVTVYPPTPGSTIEVEIEVGAVTCRLSLPNGTPARLPGLALLDPQGGSYEASARVSLDEEGIGTATLLARPGIYDLALWTTDLDEFTPQTYDSAVEIRAGELQTLDWTPSTGASLYGSFARPWTEDHRLFLRDLSSGSWYVTPEIGPDGRQFAIHNVPNGYLVLRHDQGEDRVYYPGARSETTAEVIRVSNAQDVHGLDFWR